MNQTHREMLEKQLALLSERSQNASIDELATLTHAMVALLQCLDPEPAWFDRSPE